MAVRVYTVGNLFTNEGSFVTLRQAQGTLFYPNVGDDVIDAYADIELDLSAFPNPEEIGQVYNVAITPSYSLTPSENENLGSYPSNPPRRYYGNVSYCQGEYVNSIEYINYEKGYLAPFFYRYSPKILRPSFTDAPTPEPAIELQSFVAGITANSIVGVTLFPPYDGYRYADLLRTYKKSNAEIDLVLNYMVDLIAYADLTVISSWGYYSL